MRQKDKVLKVNKLVILYKILLGIIEFIFGLGMLLLGLQLHALYQRFASEQLLDDPNDRIIQFISQYVPYLLDHRYFIAIVFLALGLVKIMGGIGMLYRKEWARHLLIVFLAAFLPYDLISLLRHPSVFEAIYFLFNLLIVLYFVEFKPSTYSKELWTSIHSWHRFPKH